ncbi:hypothetical protein BC831DRAFT_474312 [Entophlyctis helioformis]|nr:hypothetical protein BC831DRAFT_474312 [Entophlyctis helioformis]
MITALDVAAILAGIVLVAVAGNFFVRLMHVPASHYSNGLRIACVLICVSVILKLVISYMTTLYSSAAWYCTSHMPFAALISVYSLAELEFLKIVAVFSTGISPRAVSVVQVFAAVFGALHLVSAYSLLYPEPLQKPVIRYATAWTLVISIYDVAQHLYLLHFVLYKLKGSTLAFRMQYAGVIACACGFVVLTVVMGAALPREKALQALGLFCIPAFVLCSLQCMELLRIALMQPTRKVAHRTHGLANIGGKPAGKQHKDDQCTVAGQDGAKAAISGGPTPTSIQAASMATINEF